MVRIGGTRQGEEQGHLSFNIIVGNDDCILILDKLNKQTRPRNTHFRKKHKRILNEYDGKVFDNMMEVKQFYDIHMVDVRSGYYNNPDNQYAWLKLKTIWN